MTMTEQELRWITDDLSKLVGMGIYACVVLTAIAFLLALIHDRMYRRDKGL